MVKNRAAKNDVGKAFGEIIALCVESNGGATFANTTLAGL